MEHRYNVGAIVKTDLLDGVGDTPERGSARARVIRIATAPDDKLSLYEVEFLDGPREGTTTFRIDEDITELTAIDLLGELSEGS